MRVPFAVCLLLFLGFVAGSTASADNRTNDLQANQAQKNVVDRIATVDGQVEIMLTSDDPFIPRNELIKLGAGDQVFMRSRSPRGGSVYTVIFMIPADAFAQLPDGAELVVYYGQKDSSKLWRFGKLDKSLLNKQGARHE